MHESSARQALADVLTTCVGCRACVGRCDVFPRVFDVVARLDTVDAGMMSPAHQDDAIAFCNLGGDCVEACDQGVDLPAIIVEVRSATAPTGLLARLRRRVL